MEEVEIILNEEPIKVKIIWKNNKNIYFRFDDDNNLVVTVHPRFSVKKVLKLIKENEASLIKMQVRKQKKQDSPHERRILGLKYEVKIDDNYRNVCFDNGVIWADSEASITKYIANLTKTVFTEEINKKLEILPDIP